MDCFVGLDVSLRPAAVCVIDGDGRTVPERRVACEIDDISGCLADLPACDLRIGFEAGAMSQHLCIGLAGSIQSISRAGKLTPHGRCSAAAKQSSESALTWQTRYLGCSGSLVCACHRVLSRRPLTRRCVPSSKQTQTCHMRYCRCWMPVRFSSPRIGSWIDA